jgi:hypothetical protein
MMNLRADGAAPLAVTPDGREVDTKLFDADGVEHAVISGGAGAGKTLTLGAVILPGIFDHRDVAFYVDGGFGTSARHLAGACDWYAGGTREEWAQAILTAHAVMRSRQERCAKAGVSKWSDLAEDVPVITLVIDEAAIVKSELGKELEGKVVEILREGRKAGARVVQVCRDPMGTDLMGGLRARDLMATNGTLIGHRPGAAAASLLPGTSEYVDLRALPSEPGWCGITRKGQVQAMAARVRYVPSGAVLAALEGFEPLELTGEDAAAAGAAYAARSRGSQAARRQG